MRKSDSMKLELNFENGVSYPVILDKSWQNEELKGLLKGYSNIYIITQKNIRQLYLDSFLTQTGLVINPRNILEMEDGEIAKHISNLTRFYNQLIDARIDRKSCIIAFGGGVVGDFSGFVASTLLRGVAFVQFPTTLLAAVDSSVGGKVAVNVDRGKNMVGSFYQPDFVFCNMNSFKTLQETQWNCGLAEMCKHAILEPQGKLYADLMENRAHLRNPDSIHLQKAIHDSAAFKAQIVNQDERESGLRAILNLGHTSAHALESITAYKVFSHGEAVSRGLISALLLSQKMHNLADATVEKYISLLTQLELPCDTAGFSAQEIWKHMQFDKKTHQGIVRFVLLDQLAHPVYGIEVEESVFSKIWSLQKERFG